VSRFRFRGERILEWRRVQADAARVEFLRASETARAAAARVAAAEASCARSSRELIEAMADTVDVATIERYRNWITQQERETDACRQHHRERQLLADAAGQALQTANRHVRVMERLRDRAAARHAEATRQAEMKQIDELATLQFVRRKLEGASDRGC
jgi:flagellar export protein FliJ